MLDKRNNVSKNKPVANGQRTLLDLFPVKRLAKGSANQTEVPATESQDSAKGGEDVDLVDSYSEGEQSAILDGIGSVDSGPPNTPVILTDALSTPSSQPILVDDDEPELQSLDDVEVQCLSLGGSQKDPIVIESSPPQTRERRETPKQLWSIFAPRLKEPAKSPKRLPKYGLPPPPFPDADSQHVRGAQTTFSAQAAFSWRRSRNVDADIQPGTQGGIEAFLDAEPACYREFEFKVRTCSSEDDKATCLGAIPKEHKDSHPAIDKAATVGASTSFCQLWSDKWRPRRAAEVLGNEQSALYLRDWLQALALNLDEHSAVEDRKRKGKTTFKESRGIKRPRVVRAVDKRKKRRINSEEEDDSWIVYDSESEEEIVLDNEDDTHDTDTRSPQASHEHDTVYTFEQLTNTILLTGPLGSGKTACVYACAEELNWDVFEVYPGIGKRSGASIDSMIGDVGKNHLVRKATVNRALEGNNGGDSDRRARSLSRDFGFLESTESSSADALMVAPRQSLVLLEEVDILFREDVNFWPTVVNLLKDCKRPVICTCNDLSLIPTSELPLQNVLVFEACPSPVAVSYLQAVCCNEGWSVDQEALGQLYEMPYEQKHEDQQGSRRDLRRTMHRLQLWCSSTSREDRHTTSACSSLKEVDQSFWRALKHSEALSYLDSELEGWQRSLEEAAALGESDLGYNILYEEREYGDRSTLICSTATRLARGPARGLGTKDLYSTAGELFRARVDYQSEIGKGLGRFVGWTGIAQKRREIYMEYGPYIRQMIVAEDEEERRWVGRGGRRTRNSNRHRRIIGVSVSERRQLGIED